jgi:hypothetical protein
MKKTLRSRCAGMTSYPTTPPIVASRLESGVWRIDGSPVDEAELDADFGQKRHIQSVIAAAATVFLGMLLGAVLVVFLR